MSTIWQTIKKYAAQIGITYNEDTKVYNEAYTTYAGKLGTVWTEQTKN